MKQAAALILSLGMATAAAAQGVGTVNLLMSSEDAFPPPTPGNYSDFIQTDDSDPNSLAVLSTGSFVFFESESTANPGGSGPELTINGGDSIILFDPDDPSGGLARWEVILPEIGTNSLQSVTGLSLDEFFCSDIDVGSNDDLYIVVSAQPASVEEYFLIKLPSTGPDTFGAPILMAGSARLTVPHTLSGQVSIAVDPSTDPDTVYINVDQEGEDASIDPTYGISSLPGDATDDQDPVLVTGTGGSATAAALMDAIGGTGGTDKVDIDFLTMFGPGKLFVANGGNTAADVQRGDIAVLDVATGTFTEFLDAASQGGTPTAGAAFYSADRDRVGVFWYVGLDSSGVTDDRWEEYDTNGTLISLLATEEEVEAVGTGFTDLDFSSRGATTANGNYYFHNVNGQEAIFEVVPPAITSVNDWSLY